MSTSSSSSSNTLNINLKPHSKNNYYLSIFGFIFLITFVIFSNIISYVINKNKIKENKNDIKLLYWISITMIDIIAIVPVFYTNIYQLYNEIHNHYNSQQKKSTKY